MWWLATLRQSHGKSNKYNCSESPHYKVEEQDISLTKNYCITMSIKKISSIHRFILKIQQILGSHELDSNGHFWPRPPKNHWINFKVLLNLYQHGKNHFIPSVYSWDTVYFRVPSPDWPHPFLTIFNFCEFLLACKEISLFDWLILQIQLILESRDQTGSTHFLTFPTKKFSIEF